MNNPIEDLEKWYETNCNGKWEHQQGIKIETLDNPGWYLEIDLKETLLGEKSFQAIDLSHGNRDWMNCLVENSQFKGFCSARNLHSIINVFLEWSRS